MKAVVFFVLLLAAGSLVAYARALALRVNHQDVLPRGARYRAPWGVLDAVAVFVTFWLMTAIAGPLSGAVLTALAGVDLDSPLSMALRLVMNYVCNLATLALIFHLAMRGMHPLRALGIGTRPPGRSIMTGDFVYLLFVPIQFGWPVVLALVWGLFGQKPPQEQVVLLFNTPSPLLIVMLIIVATVLAPILEELTFRAFIQRGLENQFGTVAAVVITAVIFSGIHGGWAMVAALLPLSLLLGAVYARTRNILVTMALHSAFNGAAVVLLLLGKAGVPPPLPGG